LGKEEIGEGGGSRFMIEMVQEQTVDDELKIPEKEGRNPRDLFSKECGQRIDSVLSISFIIANIQ